MTGKAVGGGSLATCRPHHGAIFGFAARHTPGGTGPLPRLACCLLLIVALAALTLRVAGSTNWMIRSVSPSSPATLTKLPDWIAPCCIAQTCGTLPVTGKVVTVVRLCAAAGAATARSGRRSKLRMAQFTAARVTVTTPR